MASTSSSSFRKRPAPGVVNLQLILAKSSKTNSDSAECSSARHITYYTRFLQTPIIISPLGRNTFGVLPKYWAHAIFQETLQDTACVLINSQVSFQDLVQVDNPRINGLCEAIKRAAYWIHKEIKGKPCKNPWAYDVKAANALWTSVDTPVTAEDKQAIEHAFLSVRDEVIEQEHMFIIDELNKIAKECGEAATDKEILERYQSQLSDDLEIIQDEDFKEQIENDAEVAKDLSYATYVGLAACGQFSTFRLIFRGVSPPKIPHDVLAILTVFSFNGHSDSPQNFFNDVFVGTVQFGTIERGLLKSRRPRIPQPVNCPIDIENECFIWNCLPNDAARYSALAELVRSLFRSLYRRYNNGSSSSDPVLRDSTFQGFLQDPQALPLLLEILRCAKLYLTTYTFKDDPIFPVQKGRIYSNFNVQITEDELLAMFRIFGVNFGEHRLNIRPTPPIAMIQDNLNPPQVVQDNPNPPQVVQDNPNPPQVVQDNPNPPQVVQDNPNPAQVVQDNPNAPQVVQDNPNPPQVVQDNPNPLQVVQDNPNAPQVVQDNPNPPQVVQDNPNPPQVVQDNPNPLQVVQDNPNAPQVVQDNPNPPQVVQDNPNPPQVMQNNPNPPQVLQDNPNPPQEFQPPVFLANDPVLHHNIENPQADLVLRELFPDLVVLNLHDPEVLPVPNNIVQEDAPFENLQLVGAHRHGPPQNAAQLIPLQPPHDIPVRPEVLDNQEIYHIALPQNQLGLYVIMPVPEANVPVLSTITANCVYRKTDNKLISLILLTHPTVTFSLEGVLIAGATTTVRSPEDWNYEPDVLYTAMQEIEGAIDVRNHDSEIAAAKLLFPQMFTDNEILIGRIKRCTDPNLVHFFDDDPLKARSNALVDVVAFLRSVYDDPQRNHSLNYANVPNTQLLLNEDEASKSFEVTVNLPQLLELGHLKQRLEKPVFTDVRNNLAGKIRKRQKAAIQNPPPQPPDED